MRVGTSSLLVSCLAALALAGCQIALQAPAKAPAPVSKPKAERKAVVPAGTPDALDAKTAGGAGVISNNGSTLRDGANAAPPAMGLPPGSLIGIDAGTSLTPSGGPARNAPSNSEGATPAGGMAGGDLPAPTARLAGRVVVPPALAAPDPAAGTVAPLLAYGLLQAAPGPLVALLDTDGEPLLGEDGEPLTARAGADGAYAFAAAPADVPLLLRAALPAGRGTLAALAPATRGGAPVDLDLGATLVAQHLYARTAAPRGELFGALGMGELVRAQQAVNAALTSPPARLDPESAAAALATLRPGIDDALVPLEAALGL